MSALKDTQKRLMGMLLVSWKNKYGRYVFDVPKPMLIKIYMRRRFQMVYFLKKVFLIDFTENLW